MEGRNGAERVGSEHAKEILIPGEGLDVPKDSGWFPCTVCSKGEGANSILCTGYHLCVHKGCSGTCSGLIAVTGFICTRCRGEAMPIDCRSSLFGLEEITSALGTKRLRWYGHICRSYESVGIKRANKYVVPGSRGRGRPCKTWNDCIKKDIIEHGLSDADPKARLVWSPAVNTS